ncbi:ISL3 family transposase [Streptomyces sp. wa13]|uniref:ISL3 family transposase n=1 Tax=Streptomyces sp. wa13 TaxID=1828236 RepID=UPI003C7D380A
MCQSQVGFWLTSRGVCTLSDDRRASGSAGRCPELIRTGCGVADSLALGRNGAPSGGVAVPVDIRRGGAVRGRQRRRGSHRGPKHGGCCRPECEVWSRRIHSTYLRFPADVPSGGRQVALCLQVRRFLCPVTSCGRRTFAEQLPGLTRRYGRRTERLRSTLAAVGLALAGRAGARLARIFGVSVSRSTVLRLVEALPGPEVPALRVVGVDEYATRKGRHYGTVLVDVESRRPVDLLPDREASSLAAWFVKRPGVKVVCRDRAPFFAEGATAGAPQAVQVASLAQPERGRGTVRRRPPRMPEGPGAGFGPACPEAGEVRRPCQIALAKGTPLR